MSVRIGLAAAIAAVVVAACTPGAPPAPRDALTVLAYNIRHGEGMDSIIDLERIARLIEETEADVVALQEVDSVTNRTGLVDQTAELARLTGMSAAFGGFMDYDGGAYGMAVLSRWPMTEATNLPLPPGPEPRTALAVRVESPVSGREVLIVDVHLYGTTQQRLAQARALVDHVRGESAPIVLAGDFNSAPGSDVMQQFAVGTWTTIQKGEDHLTFPSNGPDREIDYIVYRPSTAFEVVDQSVIDEPVMSDHRPVLATIALSDQP